MKDIIFVISILFVSALFDWYSRWQITISGPDRGSDLGKKRIKSIREFNYSTWCMMLAGAGLSGVFVFSPNVILMICFGIVGSISFFGFIVFNAIASKKYSK
jgi:hypothetical protein